ncbi:MAG TPA: hypothetical protein VM784_01140 [Actinomycetota bacterium]|nr:hypothetical protein [Actinomycetota bacterium]
MIIDQARSEAAAERLTALLLADRFRSARRLLGWRLLVHGSKRTMRQEWQQVLTRCSCEPVEAHPAGTEPFGKYMIVDRIIVGRNGGDFRVRCAVNRRGRITSLFFLPRDAAMS